jgi:hypothetical protein
VEAQSSHFESTTIGRYLTTCSTCMCWRLSRAHTRPSTRLVNHLLPARSTQTTTPPPKRAESLARDTPAPSPLPCPHQYHGAREMAMQAEDIETGAWVTENITIQAHMSSHNSSATRSEDNCRHQCGLLTRTVVESPVVHWILPVRLRSADHNDVAFVGVRNTPSLGVTPFAHHTCVLLIALPPLSPSLPQHGSLLRRVLLSASLMASETDLSRIDSFKSKSWLGTVSCTT